MKTGKLQRHPSAGWWRLWRTWKLTSLWNQAVIVLPKHLGISSVLFRSSLTTADLNRPHSTSATSTLHRQQALLRNKLNRAIQANEEAPQAARPLEQDVVLQPTLMSWTVDLPPDRQSWTQNKPWCCSPLYLQSLAERSQIQRKHKKESNESEGHELDHCEQHQPSEGTAVDAPT